MHTTTSWSSPPPAWRVWEVWGRKHSAWSSTRRHGARRAAGTRSPVPASYRRRSEGGEKHRNRCTSVRLEVRPARGGTEGAHIAERQKQQENTGKEFLFFFFKGFVVLLLRRCGGCSACGDWRSQIWQRVWGRSAQVTPCRRVPSSSHAEAGGEAVRPAWVSRRRRRHRARSFLAPLLLTGVKTKLFTFYQPIMFACAMQRLLMRALNYTVNDRLGFNYFILIVGSFVDCKIKLLYFFFTKGN